jgi:hypothetical protein
MVYFFAPHPNAKFAVVVNHYQKNLGRVKTHDGFIRWVRDEYVHGEEADDETTEIFYVYTQRAEQSRAKATKTSWFRIIKGKALPLF